MSHCTGTITLQEWRNKARSLIGKSRFAELDWLISHTLGLDRAQWLAQPDLSIGERRAATLDARLRSLIDDVPLAYLIGTQPFWTLDLRVSRDTLVPRADTEVLVQVALEHITDAGPIADLGTGTGAVGLAIASEHPEIAIDAVDISPQALEVAADNAARHQINNVTFRQGNWTDPLPHDDYALVVSNPPYVETDNGRLPDNLRHEPALALAAGTDGLQSIRELVPGAFAHLRPGGWLALEHGHMQAGGVSGILRDCGFTRIQTTTDAAGRNRVTFGRRPNPSGNQTKHGQD